MRPRGEKPIPLTGPPPRFARAQRADLEVLETLLPVNPATQHRIYLDEQDSGEISYWLAWSGDVPVGRGLLHWAGPRDLDIWKALPNCPEVFDLFVREDLRSQGLGLGLLETLEADVSCRGFQRVGLGVSLTNPDAERFYRRAGYLDAQLPEYVDEWVEMVDGVGPQPASQVCQFLIKTLTPTGERSP